MKSFFFLLVLASTASAKMPETYGIPWDKALHFSAGYVTADLTQRGTAWTGIRDPYHLYPLLSAVTIASVKEGLDVGGTGWNWNDWTSTLIGGGVHWTIHF
jgi:hypothetical protein